MTFQYIMWIIILMAFAKNTFEHEPTVNDKRTTPAADYLKNFFLKFDHNSSGTFISRDGLDGLVKSLYTAKHNTDHTHGPHCHDHDHDHSEVRKFHYSFLHEFW
jgi:hypothetical protein